MLAVTRHVHYARHFTLLVCIAALLIVTSRWRVSPGAAYSFAIYGALHASVLAASLRDRQPLVRQILFVAIAALLCMLTARLGLYGMRFAGKLPSFAGPWLLLAAVSGVGALSYGILIRRFWIRDLSLARIHGAILSARHTRKEPSGKTGHRRSLLSDSVRY